MSSHLKQIAIICVTLCLLSLMITTPTEALVTLDTSQNQLSETDLSRAEWKLNHISNPGFEQWTTPHVIEDVSTYRTTEQYSWYAQAPWPVNEGTRSRGFQTRAVDPDHPAEAYLSRSAWEYWDNPTNLTLKFDWYIDQIQQPVDSDYFRIEIELGSPSTSRMYYYFGSSNTYSSNSSNYQYYFVDGPLQTWNTFDRNITQDFFDIAGFYPTQFRLFRFYLRSYSSDYSRAFIDDLWMVNNSVIIGGSTGSGDFETGGIWYSYSGDCPADISQSSTRQEGDWSLNVTTISNGNESRADVEWSPNRLVSATNPDTFSFQWMLDEYAVSTDDAYAYMYVNCDNDTAEFYLMYLFCYGIDTHRFSSEGLNMINVTGFNTTGQWNSFSRSIWSDVTSFNQTDYIIIRDVEIRVYTRETNGLTTILFDDMKLESAAMDDMGYENHGDVGDNIQTWGTSYGGTPEFTITDLAYSGSKAGNLSVSDGNSWGEQRRFENRFVNNHTDLWFDFFWRIENDTAHADNQMYLEIYYESGESLGYIFANHSAVPTGNGFDEYIILPDANTIGIWNNFQRNLFDDFVTAFGTEPNTEIEDIYLYVESGTGGRFEVLFDDVYLYTDPAPKISSFTLTSQIANQDVNVSAIVTDLSSFTVMLHYRVNASSWIDVAMIDTGAGFNATIPGQTWETEVDVYISAIDEFGQISESTQLTYQIPSEPEPTLPPDYLPLIVGVGVVIVIVGVVIVYYFFIRPKQSAE